MHRPTHRDFLKTAAAGSVGWNPESMKRIAIKADTGSRA